MYVLHLKKLFVHLNGCGGQTHGQVWRRGGNCGSYVEFMGELLSSGSLCQICLKIAIAFGLKFHDLRMKDLFIIFVVFSYTSQFKFHKFI